MLNAQLLKAGNDKTLAVARASLFVDARSGALASRVQNPKEYSVAERSGVAVRICTGFERLV